MEATPEQNLRAWITFLRDMGIYDLYQRPPGSPLSPEALAKLTTRTAADPIVSPVAGLPTAVQGRHGGTQIAPSHAPMAAVSRGAALPLSGTATTRPQPNSRQAVAGVPGTAPVPMPTPAREGANHYFNTEPEETSSLPPELAAPMPKPEPLASLFPMPAEAVAPSQRQAALEQLRAEIGDCTRCPLAYAGRHTIVFGEGNPNAELMFVGEGPGADEDASGRPFVGKAGQLLNNMVSAMGLQREQVFIANIVKCRPPKNRAPEFLEATTCSQFLLRQIDIVRPKVIVALGSTAATYVLGVRQTLASLRGSWFSSRGAKVAVTFHPAFLLRDPRQKAEAWKDLQRVMAELRLQPGGRPA